jgi:hypothetical protein
MRSSLTRFGLPARLLGFGLALVITIVTAGPAFAATAPDYAVPGGWFFTQTGGGQGQGYAVRDAGTDSSGHLIKFWSEFQRLGGVTTLGYPVGEPYVGSDGFTYDPFQRGVLQWRPELGIALLSNTFEILSRAGQDDWLNSTKGIPRPIPDDGSGGVYAKAVVTRLSWLTNSAIKAVFLANPNPRSIPGWNQDLSIALYGLPMSVPEQHGPFITQRFQRIAFQLWVDNVSGMPSPGTVVGVLGGDLLKQANLLPSGAIQPLGPGGTGPTPPVQPTPTPAPAPPPPSTNFPWHSTYVNTFPNCGTTYLTVYTRDANGNPVSGMTVKNWNDYGSGNVYIASTDGNGYWRRLYGPGAKAGTWYTEVVDGAGNQASNVVTVNFTSDCQNNAVQQVEMEFRPS